MTRTRAPVGETPTKERVEGLPLVGIILGALGILAAVWAYWLVLPGIAFGVAAIAIGMRVRRRYRADSGGAAIALGIAALVLVPSVLAVVDAAEEWGRDCALNPTNPDC